TYSYVRLVLRVSAKNPSTYVAVGSVTYDTSFIECGTVTEAPPTRPTTVSTAPEPTLGPKVDPSCNFDSRNTCLWKVNIGWHVGQPVPQGSPYLPDTDHTTNSATGHFAYLPAGVGVMQLSNPIPKSTLMCLSFFYYLYAADRSSMVVEVKQT